MLSNSNKHQLSQLRVIRQHKINKVIIDIKKSKKRLKEALKEIDRLKQEVHDYHLDRKASQTQLFDELQQCETVTIDTINTYQRENVQLIKTEEKISYKIEQAESSLSQKEDAIKNYQKDLFSLNKKMESLNKIQQLF